MVAQSPEAFEMAVAAHRFGAYGVGAEALAQARRTLEAAGLLLVGEAHGVRENPGVLLALAQGLDTRAVAFEWSWEELDEPVQQFVRGSGFDFARLWSLPAGAEFFCGDGRVTAGHFALLRRLRQEGRLEQVVLFDRLDPAPLTDPAMRERELAERLLAEWDGRAQLLVLAGAGHVRSDGGETMAAHLARRLPPLEVAMITYGRGRGWFHGPYDVPASMPPAPITLRVATATPAVVPGREDT